jgi:hypothetical protein
MPFPAVTTKGYVPGVAGVPERCPVGERVTPEGSEPDETAKVGAGTTAVARAMSVA